MPIVHLWEVTTVPLPGRKRQRPLKVVENRGNWPELTSTLRLDQTLRKPRRTYEYTSSEEEEEDEEMARRRKAKYAGSSKSSTVNRNSSRPVEPLPTDRTGIKLRYSEIYARYIKLYAELQGEKAVAERVEAGVADGSTLSKLSTPHAMRLKADEYARLGLELARLTSTWGESEDAAP